MEQLPINSNMITGVTDGFTKELELVGVGYQASVQGNRLKLQLGSLMIFFLTFRHQLKYQREHRYVEVLINNLLVLSQQKYDPLAS